VKLPSFEIILRRYPWVLNGVFIVAGSFFFAKIITAIIYHRLRDLPSLESVAADRVHDNGPSRPTAHDLASTIVERNLMQARREDLILKEKESTQKNDPNQVKPCSLSANLIGIIAGPIPETSFIIYRDGKAPDTNLFAPVEGRNQVSGDVTLLSVEPNSAKFRKEDHTEICVLGEDNSKPAPPTTPAEPGDSGGEGVHKVSDTQYNIEQSEIDKVMANLNEVATDARVVPNFENGKSTGFKLFSIRPGSIYQKIGLQNGDVVQKINGYEMNSPDKALEVYQKLRDSKSIVVQMDRHGTVKTVNYSIQ
jgi:general secretion pathway protein C